MKLEEMPSHKMTYLYHASMTDIRSELVVMNSDPTERIPVKINISIPRMKCEFLGIDIQVKIKDKT